MYEMPGEAQSEEGKEREEKKGEGEELVQVRDVIVIGAERTKWQAGMASMLQIQKKRPCVEEYSTHQRLNAFS